MSSVYTNDMANKDQQKPSASVSENRDKTVPIRMTAAEKEKLEKAAAERGMTLSAFLRWAALNAIRRNMSL